MGLERKKSGLGNILRSGVLGVATLTGHMQMPFPSQAAESSETFAMWQGIQNEMDAFTRNEREERVRYVALNRGGEVRPSPVQVGVELPDRFISNTSPREMIDFAKQGQGSGHLERMCHWHTHTVASAHAITGDISKEQEAQLSIPPSNWDVTGHVRAMDDVAEKLGIPEVMSLVSDPRSITWAYGSLPSSEINQVRKQELEAQYALPGDGQSFLGALDEKMKLMKMQELKSKEAVGRHKTAFARVRITEAKNASLTAIVAFLPEELREPLKGTHTDGWYNDTARTQIRKYLDQSMWGPEGSAFISAAFPDMKDELDRLHKISEGLQSLRADQKHADDLAHSFVTGSISATFNFPQAYAELQAAYKLLNIRLEYSSAAEAGENPCTWPSEYVKKLASQTP